MINRNQLLTSYFVGHFIIDFACAFLIFHQLGSSEDFRLCLLLYNFCAFALQMPLGLIADRINRNVLFAIAGCGMVVLSFGASQLAVLAAIVAGIGNGLFHIGGGTDVLNFSEKKPVLLGLFVSPGALGIYLGTLIGKREEVPIILVISLVLLTMAALLYFGARAGSSFRSENAPVSFQNISSLPILAAILCLLLVVLMRSYLGLTSGFSWKSNGLWFAIMIFAVVGGKACGGLLAARLGARKTSLLSLGLAAVLFLFSDEPLFGVAAIFFFNMTMPITLWAIAQLLHGSKGFSFGLLTFGLFLGFVLVYFGGTPLLSTTIGFSMVCVLSLGLLLTALRKVEA